MRGGLAGVGVVTVLAFIIAIGLWLTAPLVVGAYTTDPAILAIAAPALALATLFFVARRPAGGRRPSEPARRATWCGRR
jgi:MATE family multidrug resistance protein